MKPWNHSLLALVVAGLWWSQYVAVAQPSDAPALGPPPVALPPAGEAKQGNLDLLFEALKLAPDEVTAKAIENRIWAAWALSVSDTANLLMTRVKTAMEKSDTQLALRLLDTIIELRPDFAEAWNRRATIYFLQKDYSRSLADISEVLAREPRHFGALAGLATILHDIGDDERALGALRRVLALHPHFKGVADRVKELAEKVDGRPI
ncbi:MAG: tetratricopeptide repeat protein [Proteobacteria bacterium]|nr:tetratricopeptide repeat protein [Pseudomonadota bacterium]